MSSLRNFVVIVLLAGVLGVVYFAINKGPRPTERAELAPPWSVPQDNPAMAANGPAGVAAGRLAGFPSSAGLPGTSISSSVPPTVTLPTAGATSPASPFPSFGPTAAPPASPESMAVVANPAGVPGAAVPATPPAPSGIITGLGAIGGTPAVTPAATPTVILGQTPSNAQTVYPARNTASVPGDTAAPASYDQPAPGAQVAGQPMVGTPTAPALGPEFLSVMQSVQGKLDAGRLSEAHLDLSKYYLSSRMNPEEWRATVDLLDQLAGTVLYSRAHLLEPAYRVQPGDSLDRIAMAYNVTAELLAKINGISDPRNLVPGQELKVVRGPFEAVVDLGRHELALLVGGRYAGRFPVGVGRDRASLEGAFVVRDKRTNPIYFGPDRVIAADDPTNPLGERLLDLGNQVGIHGTEDPKTIGADGGRGAISLGPRDVDDVYDILSIGSRVTIRR